MIDPTRGLMLAARLLIALKWQPDLARLRTLLLRYDGVELVAPASPELYLSQLLLTGRFLSLPVRTEELYMGQCHENVARLFTYGHLLAIGTGYCLDLDGLWRQHSWGIKNQHVIETTYEREVYFGVLLTGELAEYFVNNEL